ncbi:MAG: ATP-binding protein [Chitinophagales bacterium]
MKKNNIIYLVIGIMAFSVLGLVAIQIYWMNQAAAHSREQFNRNVANVMQNIARKLEAREAYGFIEQEVNVNTDNNFSLPAGNANSANKNKVVLGVGLQNISDLPPEFDVKASYGVFVESVIPQSPASIAGIRAGDILTAIDNNSVNSVLDVRELLRKYKKGEDLKLTYERRSAETSSLGDNFWLSSTIPQKDTAIIGINIDSIMLPLISDEAAFSYVQSIVSKILYSHRDLKMRLEGFDIDSLISCELNDEQINIMPEWEISENFNKSLLKSTYFSNENLDNFPIFQVKLFAYDLYQDPTFLSMYFPEQEKYLRNNSRWVSIIAFLFTSLILACFVYAIYSLIRHKKISDLKTDFINNMTHELKTPVSTIQLATEMLMDTRIDKAESQKERYLQIIKDENKRLGSQIERVLQFARIERGELNLKIETVDVHSILHEVIQSFNLLIEQKNGTLHLHLDAQRTLIKADRVHLTNIFTNLMDNAVKYSKEIPDISIFTHNQANQISISFQDKGIGMRPEVQKKIFDSFYREPHGNLHNVKGFGLGLSYVKLLTEAHNGQILLQSIQGEGSTFTLIFNLFAEEYSEKTNPPKHSTIDL